MDERELNPLEQEGLVQRFEYTWELAWKLLKDYLEYEGIVLNKITPAATIRASIEANLIQEGELWMSALDARNQMAHVYNQTRFNNITKDIKQKYIPLFEKLYSMMCKNANNR
jgi:nucleotidyltransferase substrate binding protein (TIGR01987 family)